MACPSASKGLNSYHKDKSHPCNHPFLADKPSFELLYVLTSRKALKRNDFENESVKEFTQKKLRLDGSIGMHSDTAPHQVLTVAAARWTVFVLHPMEFATSA